MAVAEVTQGLTEVERAEARRNKARRKGDEYLLNRHAASHLCLQKGTHPLSPSGLVDFDVRASSISGVRIFTGGTISMYVATAVCLMLFLGATGKSAQLPLYVWLPDAMAGPTPVSALIHAATMVTAGVYMVCRMSPLYAQSPEALAVVATVGALTAIFAATMGITATDIVSTPGCRSRQIGI